MLQQIVLKQISLAAFLALCTVAVGCNQANEGELDDPVETTAPVEAEIDEEEVDLDAP